MKWKKSIPKAELFSSSLQIVNAPLLRKTFTISHLRTVVITLIMTRCCTKLLKGNLALPEGL